MLLAYISWCDARAASPYAACRALTPKRDHSSLSLRFPIADVDEHPHGSKMPIYEPIDTGIAIKASLSDLAAFQWDTNGIVADFILPEDDAHVLRVSFDRQCIVRLLDEMPLSTEVDHRLNEGLVSEHFSYLVRGADFARIQSSTWKEVSGDPEHYQFVTGWACMDVISSGKPSFAVVTKLDDRSV